MTDISRRDFALAAAASAAVGFPARAATPKALPTDPKAITEALVRIYGTSGKGPVIWKTRGTVYGVQPNAVTPLVGFRGSETALWTRKDENTWVRYSSTLSFFQDLETGKFIDEFKNPLNGKTVKVGVSYIRHKEGEYRTTKGDYYGSMKKAFPDTYKEETPKPNWTLDGDTIRLKGASNFPPILQQPSKESVTQIARASEVFDPKVETPWGAVAGWNIRVWERWLEMGDAPGHDIWHFDGVKLTSFDGLDADYLERARAMTPKFDISPEFDEGPSFFERILEARKQKPA
jgi:hypothetical protein